MQLLGRERELAVVDHAVEDVRVGGARVLGVLGEAGIGKSALLASIRARATRARLLVLDGRGVEHEREVPFGVVVAALDAQVATLHPGRLDALGHDLGAVLPSAATQDTLPAATGPAERFRHHRAVRALLEMLARERPVALLVDDLHWADEASLELVLHLLRHPPAGPHLLAFALRPVDPASRVLDLARRASGFESLALQPLGHGDSLSLLAGVRDRRVRERLAREARGNPLFLRELARGADRPGERLPDTLLAAVAAEVRALDPSARGLVEGAAVAGDPFDPELATAAAGVPAESDTLDALVRAGLVRATGDGRAFAFRHPLVRRAIYDGAPPAWRLSAHARVAAALERRGALPAARAFHVARFAPPGDEAAITLLSEAAGAAAGTAPATAAHWYAAALRLIPPVDTEQRAGLLAPMALALADAGRLVESHSAFVQVLEMLGPEPSLVTACAQVETELGRHAAARRRLLAALAGAPPEHRPGLAFQLAAAEFQEGRVSELRDRSRAAVHAATRTGDRLLLAGAEALDALGALWNGDVADARAALERATTGLNELDDAAIAARSAVLVYVSVAQVLSERYADAETTTRRALAIVRRTGHAQVLVRLMTARAMTLLRLLELDAAARELESAEEIARLQRSPRLLCFALWLGAVVRHERGETAEVERAADEYVAVVRTVEPSNITRSGTCALIAIRAHDNPLRAIREVLSTAGPRLERVEPTWASWLGLRLVRLALAAGALEQAERLARVSAAHTERLQLAAGAARATCASAEILLARGHAARAAALAAAAAEAADRVHAPLDAAEARLLAGRAHVAAGDHDRAKAALQQVASEAGPRAAGRLHREAAQQLRSLGTRVSSHRQRRAPGAPYEPLTTRELAVAELVAQGQSNKQVAAALYLSTKTVANTLTRVYAKLGVRSRSQLARIPIGTHRAGSGDDDS